ncbi:MULTISPECIES: SO_0444 family Cu/Zn efflux transporter [Pseudomonadati]|uniref:SO_0444 family Cu/Zn efflux transporter n=1 Tax=Shewanella aestuarii TaxID=1028752 RepID=A0ABT0KYH6_9GAMM|nr:SO_0444 family Cu/Zn efflux transporter [Shewanella aestuarii]MCL1116519.1 SO_0444 family Cu/Zn efflux transporter [Shewanella aestuarii]GGN71913.1 permease [Shewanella aestuarii]
MLIENFIHLFLESAPWLLLGLVLAGLLKVFVPMEWMQKQLGGHGFKTVLKAAVLGAPLPLCSCGVIPAAVGLRRSGASKAATTSFLVSTPETGVDSVTVSYVLLGPFMAIVRPIAAITSAVVAGLLVGRDDDDGKPNDKASHTAEEQPAVALAEAKKTSSCCASQPAKPKAITTMSFKPAVAETKLFQAESFKAVADKPADHLSQKQSSCSATSVEKAPDTSNCCSKTSASSAQTHSDAKTYAEVPAKASCCSSKSADQANVKPKANETTESCCASTDDMATALKQNSMLSRVGSGLHYAATDLVRDTTLWLLVGLFFAALVQTYVPGDFLAKWGDGILAMLVMVLVSVPMYICATASTPIAAGLLLAGVSPGAVLVFMMAGPATNIATLGVVSKELGKRALIGYLGGVLGVALISGMLVNYLVATFGFEVIPQIGPEHELLPQSVVAISGIVLAALMAKVLWDKLPKKHKDTGCCS